MSERRWRVVVWANALAAALNTGLYFWLGRWFSLAAFTLSTLTVIWFCATWSEGSD